MSTQNQDTPKRNWVDICQYRIHDLPVYYFLREPLYEDLESGMVMGYAVGIPEKQITPMRLRIPKTLFYQVVYSRMIIPRDRFKGINFELDFGHAFNLDRKVE